MTPVPPDLVVETDASQLGWGAFSNGIATLVGRLEDSAHQRVGVDEVDDEFAVKVFAKHRTNVHIRLRMDNTTAIAYANMGGYKISSPCQVCMSAVAMVSPEGDHSLSRTSPRHEECSSRQSQRHCRRWQNGCSIPRFSLNFCSY